MEFVWAAEVGEVLDAALEASANGAVNSRPRTQVRRTGAAAASR